MSRRLPTSPRVGILLLLFPGTSRTPFLAVPAAAFGERPFEWNQTINGTNHLDVYSSGSVAPSVWGDENDGPGRNSRSRGAPEGPFEPTTIWL